MFEPVRASLLDTFDRVADAGVVAAIGVAAREENAACGRRLEAMGELYARRAPEDDDDRASWLVDGYESLAAEVAAELRISRGRARGQLRYAIRLRDELPRLLAVLVTGVIDMRMVITIVNRTGLIVDSGLIDRLDEKLAAQAPGWMRLSGPKLEDRIDWWVERLDPAGRRWPEHKPPDRYVEIWPSDSSVSMVEGRLRACDGAALDQRLNALAHTVCRNDPRTKAQRRADAFGAMAAGLTELRCECGSSDCEAGRRPTGTQVVIHVLAEQAAVDGRSTTPGYLRGFGPVPATMVSELSDTATLKPLSVPDATAAEESGYRPSAELAQFVRWRDLTCRFPGCDRPAEVCDVDHTVPYGRGGSTHPSNLKCLCRFHHLLKTFWASAGGWVDRQSPDGTVTWTAPNGRTYTTTPGGAEFFPALGAAPGEPAVRGVTAESGDERGVMMPRRRRTRAQERDARIAAERQLNEQRLKDRCEIRRYIEKHRDSTGGDEPPPF